MRVIRVASRRSQLAMTQTKWVIEALRERNPDWSFEIVPITTKGDQILNVTLSKVGGKGLFVTEIEDVLASGQADIAIHSLKDVPFELREGMVLAGIPAREDARDALVSHKGLRLSDLPHGAKVGTASLRRAAQLKNYRSDFVIEPLRGNIDSRLSRVASGEFDAIVLAAAGLHRMGWGDRITEYLDRDICLPAVGQGILGVECRADDSEIVSALADFSDLNTTKQATAERALLARLEGSCQVPIAGYAEITGSNQITLRGLVADPTSFETITYELQGDDPLAVGQAVAEALLNQGANAFLEAARDGQS